MDKYENLGIIGEGTYGIVMKCRHIETGQIVAIKKFKESDEDELVRKTAMREIKLLKQLRHENIVNLIEVFRKRGKLYLVFEYVEKTVLEELEKNPEGLDELSVKRLMWQLIKAIQFCHKNNIVHRDIKPENLLVSKNGVLKLCDFGFARPLTSSGKKFTDYVSTRWYRAPELLVGDVSYGKGVDIWAIGCMLAEMWNGMPLFPGDSDIDQLYHIVQCVGNIPRRQMDIFQRNSFYSGVNFPQVTRQENIEDKFPEMDSKTIDILNNMICSEPQDRLSCEKLLNHPFFANYAQQFEKEISEAIRRDSNSIRKKTKRRKSHNHDSQKLNDSSLKPRKSKSKKYHSQNIVSDSKYYKKNKKFYYNGNSSHSKKSSKSRSNSPGSYIMNENNGPEISDYQTNSGAFLKLNKSNIISSGSRHGKNKYIQNDFKTWY